LVLPGVLTTIAAAHAGDAARQPAERIAQAHRLGQARRLTLDHRPGALRGLVARGEARAARGDDEAGEAVAHLVRVAATASAPSAVTR
jgi:hypothetical protein